MKSPARIAFLDIESSHLKAPFAVLLCVSWKWRGESKVHTARIAKYDGYKDPTDERELLQKVFDGIKDADIVVTHYGQRFDWPMLQTKMIRNGIGPLPNIPHIDTWRTAKYKLNLHSNRLDTLAHYFGVKHSKTALDPDTWLKATMGHEPSRKYIVEHCEADVLVLEEVYEKILPLIASHPNINLVNFDADGKPRCPTCGSDKLQHRGEQIGVASVKQRYQCMKCGRWPYGPAHQPKGLVVR